MGSIGSDNWGISEAPRTDNARRRPDAGGRPPLLQPHRQRKRRSGSLRRVSSLPNRFYDWIRHPSARSLAREDHTVSGFEHLRGHKYCLLVTYKRTEEAVPTPVWFGLHDGRLYVRSEANAAKVKRVRNDPRVRVAPCTVRGRPLGPPAEGQARVLEQRSDEEEAETALQANYGLGRKVYEGALGATRAYLEITPA